MSTSIGTATYPGGTVTTMQLAGGPASTFTQVGFASRTTGVVTVTARGTGSDKFDTVSNGAVNLATTGTLIISGSIAELKFSDAGSGSYDVTAISGR